MKIEAQEALTRAIWSATQSPTGEIAPYQMQDAMNHGLHRDDILNTARIAREEEAAYKRKENQKGIPTNVDALLNVYFRATKAPWKKKT
jgi:hypothetical protein